MKFTFKNTLKVLTIPMLLMVVYILLLAAWEVLDLPQGKELTEIVIDFFNTYGLVVVFIAAVVEGLLLVGNYVPGGTVIFIGVIASVGNIPQAVTIVSVVCIAFLIAYSFNYWLGKYGWYKLLARFGLRSTLDSMKEKLSRHMFTAIISSYWLPNLAAICATAAGVLHLSFRRFFIQSLFTVVLWSSFWGTLVYVSGDALLNMGIGYVLLIFAVWCAIILFKVFVIKDRLDRK